MNRCSFFAFITQRSRCLGAVISVGFVLTLGAPAVAQTSVTVVEYYNKTVAAYFLTGRAAEQTAIDAVADFERTGMSFVAPAVDGRLVRR